MQGPHLPEQNTRTTVNTDTVKEKELEECNKNNDEIAGRAIYLSLPAGVLTPPFICR